MSQKPFIDVAVGLPMDKLFTYRVPHVLSDQVAIGKRVLVPFGKRIVTGFCVGLKEKPNVNPVRSLNREDDKKITQLGSSDRGTSNGVKGIKDTIDVLDDAPIFDEKGLRLFQWMAYYYFAPLGEVLSLICPGGVNIKSQRHFSVTEKGRYCKEDINTLSKSILEAVIKRDGNSLASLLKTFKGKSIYSAINRLKQAGLIKEELKIKGRAGERLEIFVSLLMKASPENFARKAPIQAKILGYLHEKGEASVKLLRKELGSIDSAVKKLKEKGFVSLTQKKIQRDPFDDTVPQTVSHKPTDEQKTAIQAISQGLETNAFSPFLLYGVTGSGKTFVYLKALEQAIGLGKQAIFLVPEISLTPWPIRYLTAMFPNRVAVLHSGLSDGERYDEWHKIKEGKVDVVVGARSALFAPLKNLG
ncbi:MAG: DEAD/DEAH box helicase family protein, partial [Deltaproteobacteria bacterium]|nr:DEAD/DEAH box helicase family protein [Deltaproteobacteria bacterium]